MSEQSQQLGDVLTKADALLLKADQLMDASEQCAETQNQKLEQALSNSLVFPEILTPSYTLAISTAVGQITVDPGQQWLHRGWKIYSSDDYELAARQFATEANKTYYLRWSPVAGFSLNDLSDTTYNIYSAEYDHIIFDCSYDDMLVAKVITDNSNNVTVKPFANAQKLQAVLTGDRRSGTTIEPSHDYLFYYAWARTPKYSLRGYTPPANTYDSDYWLRSLAVTREKLHMYSWSWQHNAAVNQSPGFEINLYA